MARSGPAASRPPRSPPSGTSAPTPSRASYPTGLEADALPDEELINRLVRIRGVGRWTVEMVLMTALNRPDVLPVDDFGVREGWRMLNKLEQQPKPKELAAIGAAWAPWRSTAAFYLWRAADEHKRIKQST